LKVETDIITSIIVSPIGQVLSDNFQYHLMLTITLGEINVKMSKLPQLLIKDDKMSENLFHKLNNMLILNISVRRS